jgi:hypothetical protein
MHWRKESASSPQSTQLDGDASANGISVASDRSARQAALPSKAATICAAVTQSARIFWDRGWPVLTRTWSEKGEYEQGCDAGGD